MSNIIMSAIAQKASNVFEKLDETSQISVLDDVAIYDEAKSNDDGYRISSKDLRAKYGL